MQKIFRSHPEFVLIALTAVIVGVLAAYYFWGITRLISVSTSAIAPPAKEEAAPGFDIDGAKGLDLKGLVR